MRTKADSVTKSKAPLHAADRPVGFFEGTEMPIADWWKALWPDPASVLAKVGMKPGMELIDLCCGDGWFALDIARFARRVIAIDLNPALLKVARQRLKESKLNNCTLITGDAYDIGRLWPRPVDFVFLANVFHGVPDKPRLTRAIHDVLKPGGLFAIVNWHQLPREETIVLGEPRGPRTELRMSPAQTFESVEPSLKRSDLVELPPYHYGAVFKRPD
jgi:ubiquinone/menaquinone biosynthesis C-methylase UbiE